ncbi:hypothetical protein [Stenotrophomonas phage BUCT627]|uniref:Uncharacterized protein n=1 Tax=Stenotrophomonas phage BUCT627 TaxID=2860377 RepID=A0AC61N9V6_9CAUD|nr:hypothetical protein PQD77_gp021 [Stenotrophomonas phage BUCT627]QYC96627.1 hypothetical protein [Stenotrophomonas phage BUCT627]
MSDTDTPKNKRTLSRVDAEILNITTKYRWRGGSNSFTRGELAYGPNEIALLKLPPDFQKNREAESPVWTAPFLANGSRVRVVMERAEEFRVFPVDINEEQIRWIATAVLADVDAGMSRTEARRRHIACGFLVPALWLTKLVPDDAYDALYHDTQKKIALSGVENPVAVAAKLDFEELLRGLYLAVDAQFGKAGGDLLLALPARCAKYLEGIRTQTGTRTARSGLAAASERRAGSGKGLTPAQRRKLLGKPVWSMLADTETDAKARALAIATESGPMAGIKPRTMIRMPSDEAIREVIENMKDLGALGLKSTSSYIVHNGHVRHVGVETDSTTIMHYIAKLAAIVNNPGGWEEFRERWMEEAKLRDPDISYAKLAEVMLWPDLRVVNEVDMSIVQEVMG